MEEKEKKPKIRFKGFTEAWEQRKLGEYGDFTYGHSAPKWSVTPDAKIPCVRYGELYTKFGVKIDKVFSYTNMPKNKLVFSKGNEVLIPRVGEDPYDYNHCTWLSVPNVAIGEMISIYYTKQNPLFTAIMYNATLKNEFAIRVEGGSVTNLYYDKLKDINVAFPNKQEQEKIATLFYKIDNLITLHQRKYDKLVNVKKSLLEKMFPKNGNNVPEIRFRGFTEAWEQRKLGDKYKFLYGEYNNNPSNDGQYPVYGANGIIGGFNRYNAENSVIIGHMGEYAGSVLWGEGKHFVTYNGTISKLSDNSISSKYGYYMLLHLELAKICGGSGMPFLSYDQLKRVDCSYPIKIEEQIKIAKTLSSLDNLITLHQRKLEKLKNIKKSLLEKMFV